MVRVAMRELLSIAPTPIFTVNPMTGQGWTITADDHAFMREVLWRRGVACEQPRPDAPWAFRAPLDDEAPLAAALASWCAHRGVAQAYLYRLDRNDGSGEQIVLGLVHPADPELRAMALERARRAGWPLVLVRFLPAEPSHAAGVASKSLVPFYERVHGQRQR